MRYARSMRWLSLALVLVACGDDDDSVRVRLPDAGADAPSDAGADARKPVAVDPPVIPKPNPYWHVEHPPDSKRSWLVSPEGKRTFVLGVDSVFRDDECAGMPAYTHRAPDAARAEWDRLTALHFNATGAFGRLDVAGAPYSIVVSTEPRGDDRALRDASGTILRNGRSQAKVGDPYNPAFLEDMRANLHETVELIASDPRLQIIYLGHETGMFDLAGPKSGIRDFRSWIWSNCPSGSTLQEPLCAPHALLKSLHTTYPTVEALNTAWGTSYATFEAITKPPPACNATCGADLLRFVRDGLLATWVSKLVLYARAYAPRHAIASPRLAVGSSSEFHFYAPADTWAEDGASIGDFDPYPLLSKFDLVALDVYTTAPTYEAPWLADGLHKLHAESQLPAIIAAMGTRATIAGWTQSPPLLASQTERGDRYASQLAQLSAFPDIVGVVWHAWSDRFVPADPTRQSNEGLVQCDDAPRGLAAGATWEDFVAQVTTSNQLASEIE